MGKASSQQGDSDEAVGKLPGDRYSERLRLRFWLTIPGQTEWVGRGRVELLEAIERTGSIRQAAREMNMSYRRAWKLADALNRMGPVPMLEKSSGGARGGGTRLTPFGRRTVATWKAVDARLKRCAQEIEQWLDWPVKEESDDR